MLELFAVLQLPAPLYKILTHNISCTCYSDRRLS